MTGTGDVLVVDATGQRCPLPVITLARRIEEVPVDGLVDLRADDPAAAHDVAAWCRLRGHRYEGEQPAEDGTAPTYRVRRVH